MIAESQRRRLFFGIQISPAVRERMRLQQRQLERLGVQAKWTHPRLLHITVVFLGQVAQETFEQVIAAGKSAACVMQPFTVCPGELGVFRKNRILWRGVDSQGGKQLAKLHAVLTSELQQRTSLSLEQRPYRAHITLARSLGGDLNHPDEENLPVIQCSSWQVSNFVLFESARCNGELTYPALQAFKFENGTAGIRPETFPG